MQIVSDLLQAKQLLSTRLLKAGLRGGVVSQGRYMRVEAAVAAAGRNVHAVGVGRKVVAGATTNIPAVRIYVTQKIAPSLLSPRDRLPESIEGIPTDIIESPPAFFTARRVAEIAAAMPGCTANRQKAQRPLTAGISAAHVSVTAGTISYFCRSTRHGDNPQDVFVLSNNHVFANVNQGSLGDDLYQPGPADGGIAADHFADLYRFVEMKLGGNIPNKVDAAIGKLLPGIVYIPEICGIGNVTGTTPATEGMVVCKHGRTTGYTEGIITDESVDALIGMDHNNPDIIALFENQLRIDKRPPYSAIGLGGDSGSLVVERASGKAVGLYFANPPDGSYGYANQIADVLSELQIELL